VNTPPPSPPRRKGKKHKGRRQEVGKTRRRGERSSERERGGNRGGGRETQRGVNLRERLAGLCGDFSPAGSGCPVIYRPEPSPSLTPLLRNYTQSVANKSKKVSAALVPIHERLPRSPAASPPHLATSSRLAASVPLLARGPALRVLPPSSRFSSPHSAERAKPLQPIRSRFWSR